MLHAWKHLWNTGMAASCDFRRFPFEKFILSTMKEVYDGASGHLSGVVERRGAFGD
jgi:hypothetical protein